MNQVNQMLQGQQQQQQQNYNDLQQNYMNQLNQMMQHQQQNYMNQVAQGQQQQNYNNAQENYLNQMKNLMGNMAGQQRQTGQSNQMQNYLDSYKQAYKNAYGKDINPVEECDALGVIVGNETQDQVVSGDEEINKQEGAAGKIKLEEEERKKKEEERLKKEEEERLKKEEEERLKKEEEERIKKEEERIKKEEEERLKKEEEKRIKKEEERLKREEERLKREAEEKLRQKENYIHSFTQETRKKISKINNWKVLANTLELVQNSFEYQNEDNENLQKEEFNDFYYHKIKEEEVQKTTAKTKIEKITKSSNKNNSTFLKLLFRTPKLRKVFLEKFYSYEEIMTKELHDTINNFASEMKELIPEKDKYKNRLATIEVYNWEGDEYILPDLKSNVTCQFPQLRIRIFNVLKEMISKITCSDGKYAGEIFQPYLTVQKKIEEIKKIPKEKIEDNFWKVNLYLEKIGIEAKEDIDVVLSEIQKMIEKTENICVKEKIDEYYNLGYRNNIEKEHIDYLEGYILALEQIELHLMKIEYYLGKCEKGKEEFEIMEEDEHDDETGEETQGINEEEE